MQASAEIQISFLNSIATAFREENLLIVLCGCMESESVIKEFEKQELNFNCKVRVIHEVE